MKSRKPRSKQTLEDKVREVDSSFVEEVQTATEEQLKGKLVTMAVYDEQISTAKSNDEDLKGKKAIYDAANESYTEPTNANKLKRKLIISILSARGKV